MVSVSLIRNHFQYPNGIVLEWACIDILNSLGSMDFRIIGTSGEKGQYLWTMERRPEGWAGFFGRRSDGW